MSNFFRESMREFLNEPISERERILYFKEYGLEVKQGTTRKEVFFTRLIDLSKEDEDFRKLAIRCGVI